jgi:pimeloyl-ACP methyl ester carboxylesterase
LDLLGLVLHGDLSLPADSRGIVVFAHGSGSSRHSPRNKAVAEVLHHGRFGTLLLDLLTQQEEIADATTAEFRFDIQMLTDRLVGAIDWVQTHAQTFPLSVGLFGASTGAAAALMAAARRPGAVHAVVSRGGRPDLADASLDAVTAPTLLIVGGRDDVVLELNKQAFARLKEPKQLNIVPRATHLFEEQGALEQVARAATEWFERYLGHHPQAPTPAPSQ